MTVPLITVFLFLVGFTLCCVSLIPGLNWLLLVGYVLLIPMLCALALAIGRELTKGLK